MAGPTAEVWEEFKEYLRSGWEPGGEKHHERFDELAVIISLLAGQGMDISSLLPLIFLGGDRDPKLALIFALIQQQNASAAAAAAASGAPTATPATAPALNNLWPLLLLFMREREREPRHRRPELVEFEEKVSEKIPLRKHNPGP